MIKKKSNHNNAPPELPDDDPLDGHWTPPEAPPETPLAAAPKKGRRRQSRAKKQEILRVEELKRRLQEAGENPDAADVALSMYIPRRRIKLLGAALLRMDKLRLFLLLALLLVAVIFIFSFMQEKMGNFTINLDRLEMYRRGISISADRNFTEPTARLTADCVEDATNITLADLPTNLYELDGGNNGRNYMAYTYYLRNAGKEDVTYYAALTLDSCAKGAEYAVRVAVWHNGERTVYAMPSANGEPEEGCVNFESSTVVATFTDDNFLVGNVEKFTIAIWMEGEDPECVDAIVGGSVQFSMSVSADSDEDESLLTWFIQDIIDTLTGDKPISAAGTESPDFDKYEDVTWDTRRNQDEN